MDMRKVHNRSGRSLEGSLKLSHFLVSEKNYGLEELQCGTMGLTSSDDISIESIRSISGLHVSVQNKISVHEDNMILGTADSLISLASRLSMPITVIYCQVRLNAGCGLIS